MAKWVWSVPLGLWVIAVTASAQEAETMLVPELGPHSFESLVLNKNQISREPAQFRVAARVIGVRRELSLDGDYSQNPQDYILNAGSEMGLNEGMQLQVRRKIPVLDSFRENTSKELDVEFATVELVHVQKGLAVARLKRLTENTQGSWVGTRAVLVGDYVGN